MAAFLCINFIGIFKDKKFGHHYSLEVNEIFFEMMYISMHNTVTDIYPVWKPVNIHINPYILSP